MRFVLFSLVVLCFSCAPNGRQDNRSPEAIRKFESAQAVLNKEGEARASRAKSLLIEAIGLDSEYLQAYDALARIYISENKRDSAIFYLDMAIENKSDYAEGYALKGFLFERMGQLDSANRNYALALSKYNERDSDVNNEINKAFMNLLLHDKEAAKSSIETSLQKYPGDPILIEWKSNYLDHFDREEFMKSF